MLATTGQEARVTEDRAYSNDTYAWYSSTILLQPFEVQQVAANFPQVDRVRHSAREQRNKADNRRPLELTR